MIYSKKSAGHIIGLGNGGYLMRIAIFIIVSILSSHLCLAAEQAEEISDRLVQLLKSSDFKGGLIVHVGCGDGRNTLTLLTSDNWLVQGLDPNPQDVQKARSLIQTAGLCGAVTFETWEGPLLPYIDNLVNLIVVEPGVEVDLKECLRVLCPRGIVFLWRNGKWTQTAKPWPTDIDEWTHTLYDASGNAVSKDRRVGPPQHLQWTAGPKWTRHHESMCSFHALVSAKGRIFYILDEGPQVSLFLPSDWKLIARDAFNGKILWKKNLGNWVTQLYAYKSGPTQMTRRLVTDGDRIYVAPGLAEGVHVLDATSGETLRVLKDTAACEEILLHKGVLYLMTNDKPNMYLGAHRFSKENAWSGQKKWIRAVDPETGRQFWELETPIAPLSFAVTDNGVVFHDGKQIVCLDTKSGELHWKSANILLDSVIPTSVTPTLVQYKDVVLFIGGDDQPGYRGGSGHYVAKNLRTFTAISAKDGEPLWTYKIPPMTTGFETPKDILVLDDLVWLGSIWDNNSDGAWTGRDLHTGEIVREFKPPWDRYWFHQRCYRSRATERYLIPSRTGIEFIDAKDGYTSHAHWVRGACLYGTMPANGLMYAPPNPCGCYMESLLHGFNVMAPAEKQNTIGDNSSGERLTKGPAFGKAPQIATEAGNEWRTYRHDSKRSGHTQSVVPADLKFAWEMKIGEDLTALTVADNKVFAAEKDKHILHARDATTGKPVWQFTAGSRIDSPPTISEGRVLFGSRDGYVYCLNAADGQLVWKYRAAPTDRKLVAYEQIESVWPVHGSVLVVDGKVYCIAGRSMFLDNGMRFLAIDLHTGRKIAETILNDMDPTTNQSLQAKIKGLSMPVANPDILSYDGKSIFMKSQKFNLDGTRPVIEAAGNGRNQTGEDAHLFSASDMLDDSGFHRVSIIYGKEFPSGVARHHTTLRYAPGGKMIVFDDSKIYGFSRLPHLHRWTRNLEFHIFAASQDERIKPTVQERRRSNAATKVNSVYEKTITLQSNDKERQRLLNSLTSTTIKYNWSNYDPAMFVNSMVLTNKMLFAAGPPAIRNESTQDALLRWQGKSGGVLWSLSRANGEKQRSDYKLDAPPVFDGMAAAYGRLYLSLANGSIICFEEKTQGN